MIKRFDNSTFFLGKTILLNNRLSTYRKYLELAQKEGYYVCSLDEFFKDKDSSNKHFILRHDVDYLLPVTQKMFEIEKKLNIHSTYYFRWSTVDKELIQKMLNAGFDVGLHYETIATYAQSHNIHKKNDLPMNEIKKILKNEIDKFKIELNPEMTSCCSHGAVENVELGVSNNSLLEKNDYNLYGIKFEAYDERLYSSYNLYHIMDANLWFNYGFAYKTNPIDGMNNNQTNILFLAHPNHWLLRNHLDNIKAFFSGKEIVPSDRQFHRIAQ